MEIFFENPILLIGTMLIIAIIVALILAKNFRTKLIGIFSFSSSEKDSVKVANVKNNSDINIKNRTDQNIDVNYIDNSKIIIK